MKLKKTTARIINRVASQIDKLDLDSVFSAFGVEVIKHRRSIALPLVGAFLGGLALGALLTPVSGKDLRTKIVTFASGLTKFGSDSARELTSDGKPVASPYEDAKAERDHRDSGNPRKGVRPGPVLEVTRNHLPSAT